MKKVTKIVTLAAAAMCAFAVVGGSFAVAGAANKAYAAANASHAITYRADSAITVKGPEVAKAGSKVEIELTYNHRLYEVLSVRVGDEYAAQMNDNGKTFYFVMPNEEVDVVVNSRYLGEDETIHTIRNENADKGLYLDGCPANAKAYDLVSFSVSVAADSPYRFAGSVEVYTDDDNEDSIDVEFDGEFYTFEMPDAPVFVFTLMEGKSYFLNFDEPTLVNSVKFKDNNSFVNAERQVYDNDGDGYFIPYDADVTVSFRNTNLVLVDGVKLGDQELTFDNNLVIKFKMPGKDLDLEILTEAFYRPIVVDTEGYIDSLLEVDYNYTSHYDFTFRRSATSSGTYEEFDITQTLYGDYVRMYVTQKAGFEDRKPTPIVMYLDQNGLPYNSAGSFYQVSTTKGTDANGDYYQWNVTASHYGYIIYVYREVVAEFIGYPFVGTYKYANVYSQAGKSVTVSSVGTIDDAGSILNSSGGTTGYYFRNGDQTSKTGPGTVLVGDSQAATGLAFYGANWFIRSWTLNAGAQNTYDLYVYYKTTSTVMYRQALNRSSFCVLEAIIAGEVVSRVFYTLKSGSGIQNIWYDVELEFKDSGTNVLNSKSYDVKANGTVIGSVSGTTLTTSSCNLVFTAA